MFEIRIFLNFSLVKNNQVMEKLAELYDIPENEVIGFDSYDAANAFLSKVCFKFCFFTFCFSNNFKILLFTNNK